MKIEHVVLPEPGRELLMKTHPTLARQFPDAHGEQGFVIGGGTMLAARWQHRASRDVDVRVSDKPGHQLLSRMLDDPRLQTWMNWAMEKAGATHRRRLDRHQLIYFFEPMAANAARVDLVQGGETIEGETVRTHAEGLEFWSATNCAILAAKWKWRRELLEVKDVFDFAVAALDDGPALQRALAVDTRGDDLNNMIEMLGENRARLRKEAERELDGVPKSIENAYDDPARHCAMAIGVWTARAVEIEHEDGLWRVTATCRAQPQGTPHGEYEHLESAAKRAAQLAGLTDEELPTLMAQAQNDGGARRTCAASALTAATGPDMRVGASGNVTIRDFGAATVEAPDIESAAKIAIDRGWEPSGREQAVIAELKELQGQAIAAEAERSSPQR